MWQVFRLAPGARLAAVSTVHDLIQTTARSIMLITSGFFLASAIVLGGNAPADVMIRIFAIAAIFVLAVVVAYRWLADHYLLAQLIWQAGLIGGLALAIVLLNRPEIGLLFALLPLVAMVTIGGAGAAAATGLTIAVAWWVSSAEFSPALPAELGLTIVVVGVFTGLLGWAVTGPLLTVTEWSLRSFEQANRHLEEAREQRLELLQAEEDLLKANRELARLSDRLKALQRIAEEARQAKAEFVANVSHELRTPLNMIIGFTEIIARSPQVYGGKLPTALLTDIAAVQRNSQHLATLVNDVLDLSQVEAGRMALSCTWTALPIVIEAAREAVKALFDAKGLYLRSDIAADLPEVFCDETRIRQVIINLLSNAGRFTDRGGVTISCRRQGNEVVISVADTGPGISAEDQCRLFEPFQQLDPSIRRRHGGSGLGLAISKQFVEMHGGKIWVESPAVFNDEERTAGQDAPQQSKSQSGPGTRISFSLPLEPSMSAEPASIGVRRAIVPDDEMGFRFRTRPARTPVMSVPPRLVVVEREQTLQRLLRRYLPSTEIVAAPDMAAAVAELSRSPAQALVINASPLEQISPAQLTNLPYDTPAITCWVPGEDDAARRLGVVKYLVKPISAEKLLGTLRALGDDIRTVLVVDDEPDELHLFARMLEADERGYRILQVTNGQRALAMLRSRRPDVMLLDLIMAGVDGFQVLEEKGRDPTICHIPVIVISSRDPAGDPVVSNTLTVTRGSGLSARSLLAFIAATGEILSPVK